MSLLNKNLNYDQPIKLADDVFWVGFADSMGGLYCNPYLIVDGDEAVLLDGGSRPDFSTVVMKIMETGTKPKSISNLIYHHYDPDLCGSIPNLENLIDRPDLQIISHKLNNAFISYYGTKSKLSCILELDQKFVFKSGRTLRFIPTPYSHSPGSFVTLDEKTGIVFTSDIFGSFSKNSTWDLFCEINNLCYECDVKTVPVDTALKCDKIKTECPLSGIFNFHKTIMTSGSALKYSIGQIRSLNPKMLAPQHGSIIHREKDIEYIISVLSGLTGVGIDGVINTRKK